MTTKQLDELIAAGDVPKLKSTIEALTLIDGIKEALDQYEIGGHDVANPSIRKDKSVYDEDEHGNKRLSAVIPVTRIPLPMQKKIVMTATAFLGLPEMTATPDGETEENFLKILDKIQEDNKFDYKFNKVVKTTKSEKQCAILVYTQPLDEGSDYWNGSPISQSTKFRLRYKVLSRSNGDELYPVCDSFGDMIAFGRAYKVQEVVDGTNKEIEHFDLYTAKTFYFYENRDDWNLIADSVTGLRASYENLIGKIPIAYFSQPYTEWHDVQKIIDRLEMKISNHADTNDYFDAPIIKAKGDVQGFSDKGEQGKVLELGPDADVEYLTYSNLPESLKLELDNLKDFIGKFTHTPDTSFENLKNLGYFSTIALKVMFMDAHMKAYDSEEIFGEGTQRLYNYLKKAVSVIAPEFQRALTMQIKPVFNYFLPKNEQEEVETLIKAYEAGGISERTFGSLMPFVEDTDAEFAQIEKEKEDKAKLLPPMPPPINSNP